MNCKKIKHILLGVAVVMFFACSGNNASEPHVHGEECEHSHSHEGHEHSHDCDHNHEGHEHSHDCEHEHQPHQE